MAKYSGWTFHSSEKGLAVVKQTPVTLDGGFASSNYRHWLLAGTRYVNLAILVRRSFNYPSFISNQLRVTDFDIGFCDSISSGTLQDEELASQLIGFARLSRNVCQISRRYWRTLCLCETTCGLNLYRPPARDQIFEARAPEFGCADLFLRHYLGV